MFTECPFCHRKVLRFLLDWHVSRHTSRRSDGQMRDHITKPEKRRYKGALDGVPQVYEHRGCGGVTGMPEDIIRSYLVDPTMYSDRSFCTGCGDYVTTKDLFWVETGESLFDYNRRLRSDRDADVRLPD